MHEFSPQDPSLSDALYLNRPETKDFFLSHATCLGSALHRTLIQQSSSNSQTNSITALLSRIKFSELLAREFIPTRLNVYLAKAGTPSLAELLKKSAQGGPESKITYPIVKDIESGFRDSIKMHKLLAAPNESGSTRLTSSHKPS